MGSAERAEPSARGPNVPPQPALLVPQPPLAGLEKNAKPRQDTADKPAATANPSTAASPVFSPALAVASGIIDPTSMTNNAPAAKPSTAPSNRSAVTEATTYPPTVASAQTAATA